MNHAVNLAHSEGLNRRAVLHGAAWFAPTVVVAVAAPDAAASIETGTITVDESRYVGTRNGNRVDFPVVRNTVSVRNGVMPTTVRLEHHETTDQVDLRRDAGWFTSIDPATGRFAFDGLYNSITGGADPDTYTHVFDNKDVDFAQATTILPG